MAGPQQEEEENAILLILLVSCTYSCECREYRLGVPGQIKPCTKVHGCFILLEAAEEEDAETPSMRQWSHM